MLKELNENYISIKKDIEAMNQNQLERKNTQERIESQLNKAEDQISDLEDKAEKNTSHSNKMKKKDLNRMRIV